MTYSVLFCTGKFIFKEWTEAAIWFTMAVIGLLLLRKGMSKTKILE
jgi:hypothetical protein